MYMAGLYLHLTPKIFQKPKQVLQVVRRIFPLQGGQTPYCTENRLYESFSPSPVNKSARGWITPRRLQNCRCPWLTEHSVERPKETIFLLLNDLKYVEPRKAGNGSVSILYECQHVRYEKNVFAVEYLFGTLAQDKPLNYIPDECMELLI